MLIYSGNGVGVGECCCNGEMQEIVPDYLKEDILSHDDSNGNDSNCIN